MDRSDKKIVRGKANGRAVSEDGEESRSETDTPNARAREGQSAAEWVAIMSLIPWDRNPRKNDGEPVKRVMRSIEELGFGAPIVARREDSTIIAGHTRWKAAQALGMDLVPVRFVDLSPAKARLMALADNRLGELTEWDGFLLKDILSEISLDDAELAGWSSKDIEKMADELLGADDDTDKVKTDFSVLVECSSESEQLEVLDACERKGWQCRALI